MIFPLETGSNNDRRLYRINLLIFYLSIALITSSASFSGWGVPVLAVLLSASYLHFYFDLRRSRHARYQRSFIHGQRNTNS
jgi:Ca2+/Na+ antiporter